MKNNKIIKILFVTSIILLIASFLFTSFIISHSTNTVDDRNITYNQFLTMVEEGEVDEVHINLREDSEFVFINKAGEQFYTDNPKIDNFKEMLLTNDVKVIEKEKNSFADLAMSILQLLLYFGLFYFFFSRMMPKQKNDDVVENVPKVTFDDVAGSKELKKDVQFVIEYLKDPSKYNEMGARMPKGIVLYGPPGTGKTLTAKAIAGTAGVPFFSVSGSDFIEMYVGLGAKRVRDLYKKARAKAPCIVFVDEIDAVGVDRGSKASHSENNQTINALLNELDGFNGSEGVLTICATNRLEDLDSALIRPGRFDKQLAVPLPEKEDRIEILKVHAKGKKFEENIDWNSIAAMTVGFSGAAIESMLNEAAFLAVNNKKPYITMEEIDRAFYKVVMKGDKKENQSSRDKKELEIVAWHEAGHALATKLYTNDSVPKVTIVSSTSGAGGVTFRTPPEMSLLSKRYIKGLMKVMYAGRASEQILLKDGNLITTGASMDIKQATQLIKNYIGTYGMDDEYSLIDLSAFGVIDNNELIERCSSISKEMYKEVLNDLTTYQDALKDIASALLEKESIVEKDIDEILEKHNIEINTTK